MSVRKYVMTRVQLLTLDFFKTDLTLGGSSIAAQLDEGERYMPVWYQAKLAGSESSIQEGVMPNGSSASAPLNLLKLIGNAQAVPGGDAKWAFYDESLTLPADFVYQFGNLFKSIYFNPIEAMQVITMNMIVIVLRPAGAFDEGYK